MGSRSTQCTHFRNGLVLSGKGLRFCVSASENYSQTLQWSQEGQQNRKLHDRDYHRVNNHSAHESTVEERSF
eukprot:3556135-Amphidinium_carterae.1